MTSSFKDYVAWVEPIIDLFMKDQQKKFSAVLDPLRQVGFVQSYLNDERQDPRPVEPRALYIIGAQTTQLSIGIYQSLSAGAVIPAAGNFRTLFELLLSAKLIQHGDREHRSDLYMDFLMISKWNHVRKLKNAKVTIDTAVDVDKIEKDYQAIKANYASNATYWWSSILWSEKDARERKTYGPMSVCAFLDGAGVFTGIANTSFAELDARWYDTFSPLTHGSTMGSNAMIASGRPSMGWQIDQNATRVAALALSACTEIISICEEGLDHPKAGWARMHLSELRDKAVLAQRNLEA